MKVAIYDRKGSFSDRWMERCDTLDLPYVTVDLFDDALFETLRRDEVDVLLSHPPMGDRRGGLAASAILNALAASACCHVFPTPSDYWHFDDKIAQKYLFDAVGIPTPTTHVFLDREHAMDWADHATFPWVFKLSAGAGAVNVSLIRSQAEAVAKINRMFGRGYPPHAGAMKDVGNKLRAHKRSRDWLSMVKRAPATLAAHRKRIRELDRERGYVYFQQFIPGNTHDTRVTVVGDRAFAFRRRVRPGDFRASGSGSIDHDPRNVDVECVTAAFTAAERLGTTCIAFDFVRDEAASAPLIVEMSCAFDPRAVRDCPGHWLRDLTWHDGHMWPQDAILDDVLEGVREGVACE